MQREDWGAKNRPIKRVKRPNRQTRRNLRMISALKKILYENDLLFEQLKKQIEQNREDNDDRESNPVQSVEELWSWLDVFMNSLPWDGLKREESSVFRRIDQSIGYFYYIFGELQYEPKIAEWMVAFNKTWGEWLNSDESWSEECYEFVKTDGLFELDGGKYEDASNWHSWNDFFSRKLKGDFVKEDIGGGLIRPCDGEPKEMPVKTMTLQGLTDLMGNSEYRERFVNGEAIHYVLDVYHYHRYHAPVSGTIREAQVIPGWHTAGGRIVWDKVQNRYRYELENNTNFQCLETRGVLVIERENGKMVAMIPVGVAQVSSVNWRSELQVGANVDAGQELGWFACGGSDVVLLREK